MKQRIIIIFSIATSLIFSACRKQSLELIDPNTAQYTSPLEQFEIVWNGINNSYAFWDIDPTNWDSIYNVYYPIFEELNKKDTIATKTLEAHYFAMCQNFIDHHMAIRIRNPKPAKSDETNNFTIRPGLIEAKQRDYYHEKFSDSLLLDCFEKMKSEKTVEMRYGKANDNTILACNIDGIAYLKLSSFMLTEILNSTDSANLELAKVYKQFETWRKSDKLKGIIFDQRGNGGGYLNDMNYIIAPFITEPLTLGETRQKEGLGRYDYSVWVPFTLQPTNDAQKLEVPLVALADINSVSMGEMTTYAIAQMPNGCFIGERTFGGHGPLFGDFDLTYSGTFGDKELKQTGHFVYTSSAVTRFSNGKILEGIGITPTYTILYDDEKMRTGEDVQLNAAIDYILTGKITIYK